MHLGKRKRSRVAVLICLILWGVTCGPADNPAGADQAIGSIIAVLAHSDDETIISGTLAKLASSGFDITVVYTTSGDDGPDETGKGLHGDELGEIREQEAVRALQTIGIENPPVFLRFPDLLKVNRQCRIVNIIDIQGCRSQVLMDQFIVEGICKEAN